MREESQTPRDRYVKLATAAAVFIILSATSPQYATAGPGSCVATMHLAFGQLAIASGFTAAMHTGCTLGMKLGSAIACNRATAGSGLMNKFTALWAGSGARIADSTGGCSFVCVTGGCFVGNDALPVELLQFGVE